MAEELEKQEVDVVDAPQGKGKRISRREVLAGAVGAAGALAISRVVFAQVPVPPDSTKVLGRDVSAVGSRSQFETPKRSFTKRPVPITATVSLTPLGDLDGIICPADLHYERHHNGVPEIDPKKYKLLIHGMVSRPMTFTLDDLKRYPRVSRIHFLECSGNSGGYYRQPTVNDTAQTAAGLTSTSEWVGVPLTTLFAEIGVDKRAAWAVCESYDGAAMTRSIPIAKMWDDALIAYGQNGEAIRPEQGYPARLLLPGWEGNANIKWIRRIEITDRPAMSREETSKYTDIRCGADGKDCVATQFTMFMDAKSIVTFPSGGQTIPGPGFWEIRGIAWSGRGFIERVEVSTDGGKSWGLAKLELPVLDRSHTRFRYLWKWDGKEAVIMSRATDSTGYIQPSREELLAQHGGKPSTISGYHSNQIFVWKAASDGKVTGYVAPA